MGTDACRLFPKPGDLLGYAVLQDCIELNA